MEDKQRYIQGGAPYVPEPAELGIVPLPEDARPSNLVNLDNRGLPRTAPFHQKPPVHRQQPTEASYVPEPADLGIVPLPAEARTNTIINDFSPQRRTEPDLLPQGYPMLVNPPPHQHLRQSRNGHDYVPEPADLGIVPLPEEVRQVVRSHSPQQYQEMVHEFHSYQEGGPTLARPRPSRERDGGYVPEPAHLGIAPLWGPNPNLDTNPSAPLQEYSDAPPPYEDQHLYRTITK